MPDIKTLAAARNVDLVNTFTKSLEKLTAMLSTCAPIHAAVGETLHQKKITGKLSEVAYTAGQDIPLSSYTYEDVTTFEVTLKPYRKQTTLQEVKKRGYDGAVDKTDAAMISDMQRNIKKDFVAALGADFHFGAVFEPQCQERKNAHGTGLPGRGAQGDPGGRKPPD